MTLRLVTDDAGTPKLVLDTDAKLVVHEATTDPWGVLTAETGVRPASVGVHGGLYDADTGLTRIGHRDYDPVTGRFLQPDPFARHSPRGSAYALASGDPINDASTCVTPFSLPGEEGTRRAVSGVRLDSLCGVTPAGELRCGDGAEHGGVTTDLPSLSLNVPVRESTSTAPAAPARQRRAQALSQSSTGRPRRLPTAPSSSEAARRSSTPGASARA